MKIKGKIQEINIDYVTRKPKFTFICDKELSEEIDDLMQYDISLELKKWHEKRSLDANAYCWLLINKIAEKTNLKSIEVYRKQIQEVGSYEVIPIKNEATEKFKNAWQKNGLGWLCETFPSKLDGFTNVRAFYGSSVYDSKEMNRLIDNIIQDCKSLGIETMTNEEIESLKKGWK